MMAVDLSNYEFMLEYDLNVHIPNETIDSNLF